jgi:uracil-DNA glycosylase
MPMAFCYPGVAASGGDAPPRRECAPLWHARLRAALPAVRLVLLVGGHAQKAYLPRVTTMTETVRRHDPSPDAPWPLPHPSWRSIGWMRRNPWFETDVVPALQARVAAVLA